MKVANNEFTGRPWRIHEVAGDFDVEDVWELPGRGGPGDFPRLVEMIAAIDTANSGSPAVRALFALRWKLGAIFGWDDEEDGLGGRTPTLRERLPQDLRDGPAGPQSAMPFTPLFLTDDEWAAEIANQTMHGVMHIGAVPDENGEFRALMTVLVKPNGLFGRAYMAAIRPFRHLLIYPALLREGGRLWEEARRAAPKPAGVS
jgi:hypothetical protein